MNSIDQNSAMMSLEHALVATPTLIDNRTEKDRLSFLVDFAALINFYDRDNNINGDWTPFLLKDPVFLIASIAKIPFNRIQSLYLRTCLELKEALTKNKSSDYISNSFNQLFDQLTKIFRQIERWTYYMLKSNYVYDLKSYVINEVTETYSALLWALLSLREQLYLTGLIPNIQPVDTYLYASYDQKTWRDSKGKTPFWELLDLQYPLENTKSTPDDFYVSITNVGNELFSFFKGIIGYAHTEFETIKKQKDQFPDTLLLRTFTELMEIYKDQVNTISNRHLKFYYKDILKQKKQLAVADTVFISADLAKEDATFILPKLTLFNAGQDSNEAPILFESIKDVSLNPASIGNIYTLSQNTSSNETVDLYLKKIEDSDTVKMDEEGKTEKWKTFGSQIASTDIPVTIGFAFSSPMLFLEQAKLRTLTLNFTFTETIDCTLFDNATYFLSTQSDWFQIPNSTDYILVSFDDCILTITITLQPTDPVISNFSKNPDGLTNSWPMFKISFSGFTNLASPPEITTLDINVKTKELSTFQLYNDYGTLASKKPFQPLGPTPEKGQNFILGSSEIFSKPVDSITLQLNWNNLPPSFSDYYEQYNDFLQNKYDKIPKESLWGKIVKFYQYEGIETPAKNVFDDTCFQVQFQLMQNGLWQPFNMNLTKVIDEKKYSNPIENIDSYSLFIYKNIEAYKMGLLLEQLTTLLKQMAIDNIVKEIANIIEEDIKSIVVATLKASLEIAVIDLIASTLIKIIEDVLTNTIKEELTQCITTEIQSIEKSKGGKKKPRITKRLTKCIEEKLKTIIETKLATIQDELTNNMENVTNIFINKLLPPPPAIEEIQKLIELVEVIELTEAIEAALIDIKKIQKLIKQIELIELINAMKTALIDLIKNNLTYTIRQKLKAIIDTALKGIIEIGVIDLIAQAIIDGINKETKVLSQDRTFGSTDIKQVQKTIDPSIQNELLSFTDTSTSGFIKMQLEDPIYGFGANLYPKVVSAVALYNAELIAQAFSSPPPKTDLVNTPNPPYAPLVGLFTLDYEATATYTFDGGDIAFPLECFYYTPFQNYQVYDNASGVFSIGTSLGSPTQQTDTIPLLPTFKSNGQLFLELSLKDKDLVTPSEVSFYFELARDYSNSTASTKTTKYYYLGTEGWTELTLLSDGTNDFSCSGIITFNIPGDITNAHITMPGTDTSYWISIATGNTSPDDYAQTVFLKTNGIELQRTGENYLLDTKVPSIKADTITNPHTAIPEIATITQPFQSFGGLAYETGRHMNLRVSTRLRTKDRLVSLEDYFRVIKQVFPTIYYSKTFYDKGAKKTSIYVVKQVNDWTNSNAFTPLVSECEELKILDYLKARTSTFVDLIVSNFNMKYIKVTASILIAKGYEPSGVSKEINTDINIFLSPWIDATQQQITIDKGVNTAQIASFIKSFESIVEVESISIRLGTKDSGDNNITYGAPVQEILPEAPSTLLVPSLDYSSINYHS